MKLEGFEPLELQVQPPWRKYGIYTHTLRCKILRLQKLLWQNNVDKPKINLFKNEQPQAKHISLFEVWNILLYSKFEMDFLSWQSPFHVYYSQNITPSSSNK